MAGTTLPFLPAPAAGCNCGSCPWYVGNPDAVEPICSGCNTDCSYCSCARTEAARRTPDACGQCSIRCGSRVDIQAWMADVGGTMSFDDIALRLTAPEDLPRFVPQVDTKELGELDTSLQWPAYAIGLRRVLSPATRELLPGWRDTTAAEALGLGASQRAVLVGYGEDPLVEAFWTRRHQLIPQLVEHEWDLVLSCNYSMYGNYPRTEMLLNFRRNLLLAQEMCDAGIPAVPNLYWFRIEDLRRYEAWAADTDPPAVAVNLQTFRTDVDWETSALPGLTYLAETLPSTIRMIVTGASRADRIAELTSLFGRRLHLVAQNALAYARRGAVMTDDGREDVHAHVADAFAANVRFYDNLVRQDRPG